MRFGVAISSLLVVLGILCFSANAFQLTSNGARQALVSRPGITRTRLAAFSNGNEKDKEKIPIPKEIEQEIFEAERRTPAAQGRANRLIGYSLTIVVCAIFFVNNAVFTESGGREMDSSSLWYQITMSNPLFFTDIGGYVLAAIGTICAFLVENELVGRDETRQQIWDELRKRKEERMKTTSPSGGGSSKKNLKMSGKKAKRRGALTEILGVEEQPVVVNNDIREEVKTNEKNMTEEEVKEGGLMGKMKEFYKKADDMAAAQALILNKNLEDAGVIDKITDESGLRVIGKDEASKIGKDKKEE